MLLKEKKTVTKKKKKERNNGQGFDHPHLLFLRFFNDPKRPKCDTFLLLYLSSTLWFLLSVHKMLSIHLSERY